MIDIGKSKTIDDELNLLIEFGLSLDIAKLASIKNPYSIATLQQLLVQLNVEITRHRGYEKIIPKKSGKNWKIDLATAVVEARKIEQKLAIDNWKDGHHKSKD